LNAPIITVAASMLLVQSAALAQSNRPAELEEIVVTGIRAGLRSSLELKKDSIQVVDAISAEDVGDFPDKNIGEALQRVTGVQITRQDGEGRAVSIRGADPALNRTEINGVTALSLTVTGGRDVDFRDIPVEFLSRVEVVKSATPDMPEGGVGGTIRVFTRRPFDSAEPFLAGSAQTVYSDLADSWDPKVGLIGSSTFFDNTFGVLVGLSYEQRHLDSHNARTTGWLTRPTAGNPAGRGTDINSDGTPDFIPEIPRYIMDRRETERPALNTILEWRPNEDITVFAEGTYARGKEEVSSMFLQLGGATGVIDYANSSVGAGNTVNHLEITSTTAFPIDLAYRNINGSLTREQYTTSAGLKWNVGSFAVDGRVNYSSTDVQNDEKNSTATIFGVPRAVIDYRNGEQAPNMSFPGLDTTTGTLVNTLAAVFNPRTNTQSDLTEDFNVEYLPEESSWLTSIKTGVRHTKVTMDSLLYQRTTTLTSRTPPAASAGATTVVPVAQSVIQTIIDGNSGVNDVRFFDTGDLGFDGIGFWNDNGDATYDATVAASGIAGGNNPYGVNANPNTNGTFQNYLDTWDVEEETLGVYLQGSFKFGDVVSGTLGARYVDTDTVSAGYNRVQNGTVISFPRGEREGGYSKLLPSLNMRFDLNDQFVGRLSAGKVMARANPNQLALRRSTDIIGLTGSRGNPDLKPFLADQYDLGVEWYFSQVSYASIALFRKEISSFITTVSDFEDIDGIRYSISRPINGQDNVTINGIEAGLQLAFDFLPKPFDGFGLLANMTYQDDKGFRLSNAARTPATFPGLSNLAYNASLYYENDRFSVRTSYNWREEWLITPSGRGALPEYNEDYGTLDASFNYNFTPNITMFLEAVNLLGEPRIENNNSFRRIGNETFGSRYFFGIRAKL
jgi:iron complex outermembrane recepter protein